MSGNTQQAGESHNEMWLQSCIHGINHIRVDSRTWYSISLLSHSTRPWKVLAHNNRNHISIQICRPLKGVFIISYTLIYNSWGPCSSSPTPDKKLTPSSSKMGGLKRHYHIPFVPNVLVVSDYNSENFFHNFKVWTFIFPFIRKKYLQRSQDFGII